jgi:NhaP-type Na+/H+ or K+/H+ antiporter
MSMILMCLLGLVAILLWSLVGRRIERWGLSGPIVLALLGALAVVFDTEPLTQLVDAHATEHVVEVILAVILFADATQVHGGFFGGETRVIARLVLIGLPLSLILAVFAGSLLLPGSSFFVVIVMAAIVMPTDFSSATKLLRTRRIPARLRSILNVESGYNDGVVSPVFSMSLAMAVAWPALLAKLQTTANGEIEIVGDSSLEKDLAPFGRALMGALPATVYAVAIGAVIGALVGLAVRWSRARGYASVAGVRYALMLVPVVTYLVATLPVVGANGFVAAFVAGLLYRTTRAWHAERSVQDEAGVQREPGAQDRPGVQHGHDDVEHELILVEDVGVVSAQFIWFILGGLTVLTIEVGIDWPVLLFAVLALTLLRIVPVYISLLGSTISPRQRLTIGALGPRGTASIVFALLAYNELREDDGNTVLILMVYTVIGSILLHGVIAPIAIARHQDRAAAKRSRSAVADSPGT